MKTKIRINFLISIFIFSFHPIYSQSAFSSFLQLSRPEKCWVVAHPFVSKKTYIITRQVISAVYEMKKDTLLGKDINGGQLDAFKHAYWMAMLAKSIHPKKAYKLGLAHEKGNYFQFRAKTQEENILPDSVSSVMDLANNQSGIEIGIRFYDFTKDKIKEIIVLEIKNGNLKIILKDENANFLDCDGKKIDMNFWKEKWNIPKCLVSSNNVVHRK